VGSSATTWSRALGGLIAALALAVAVPTAAQGRAALDPSFGKGGLLVTKLEGGQGTFLESEVPEATRLRDGRIEALLLEHLYGIRASGRADDPVRVARSPRDQRVIRDVTADRRGGLLLAGEARPDGERGIFLTSSIEAMIVRYGPDGQLDRGFGRGGVLLTDFGLGPPTATAHTYPSQPAGTRVGAVFVRIEGIAVDGRGRMVITGTRAFDRVECRHGGGLIREAFVARLQPNGTLDRSFGEHGTVRLSSGQLPFNTVGPPILDPNGGIFVAPGKPSDECLEYAELSAYVVHLDGGGRIDTGFSDGLLELPESFGTNPELAANRRGGVLVLSTKRNHLMSRRNDGSLDTRFGTRGLATPFPNLDSAVELDHLQLDASGQIWAAGTFRGRRRRGFFLAHLRANGRPDGRFGRRGRTIVDFRNQDWVGSGDLLLDGRGRPVIVGAAATKINIDGLALARFLPPR